MANVVNVSEARGPTVQARRTAGRVRVADDVGAPLPHDVVADFEDSG